MSSRDFCRPSPLANEATDDASPKPRRPSAGPFGRVPAASDSGSRHSPSVPRTSTSRKPNRPFWRVSFANHHGHVIGLVFARSARRSDPTTAVKAVRAAVSATFGEVPEGFRDLGDTPSSFDVAEVPFRSKLPSVHSMGSLVLVGSPDSRSTTAGARRVPSDFSFGSLAPTPTFAASRADAQGGERQLPASPTPPYIASALQTMLDVPSTTCIVTPVKSHSTPPSGSNTDMPASVFAFAVSNRHRYCDHKKVEGLSNRPWNTGVKASGPAFVSRALAVVLNSISNTLLESDNDKDDTQDSGEAKPRTPPNSENDEPEDATVRSLYDSRRPRRHHTHRPCGTPPAESRARVPRDPFMDSLFFRTFRNTDESTAASSVASPHRDYTPV